MKLQLPDKRLKVCSHWMRRFALRCGAYSTSRHFAESSRHHAACCAFLPQHNIMQVRNIWRNTPHIVAR